MTLEYLHYNHKNSAMFCAPNSIYIQINTILDSMVDKNYHGEIIDLNDIATRIGYSNSTGATVDSGHLSKLSNRINNLNEKMKLKVPKLMLKMIDTSSLLKKIKINPRERCIFTICMSFGQYYKFLKKHNSLPEYYNGAEEIQNDLMQHCITVITNSSIDKKIYHIGS